MKPVPVAYFIGSLQRCGTAVHLLAVLRNLDRKRFLPWVACLAEQGPIADDIGTLGIDVVNCDLRTIYSLRTLKVVMGLAARIRRSQTSIVQSYLFLDNILAPLAARLGGAEVVITGRRTVDDWESPRHRRMYRLTNRWVDRIVVVSKQVEASVRRLEGVPAGRLVCILNAQSMETLTSRSDSNENGQLAQFVRKTEGKFVYGTVGNVRPIKGHDLLVEAFSKVHKRHSETHLAIVGKGPSMPQILKMAADFGLEDSVHLVGHQANVAAFLDRFDVFVISSRAEGMSNALLEALIMGKPVVSTRFGLPVLESGEEVVLGVEPGDTEALATAMETVLVDEALRAELSFRARSYAAAAMSEKKMVLEYEELYEELLGMESRNSRSSVEQCIEGDNVVG